MKVHLIGLPHTSFDDVAFSSCAFTAKAVRMNRMLRSRGIETVVYWGGDMGDVSLMSLNEQFSYFGAYDPAKLPVIEWDLNLQYWHDFNNRAIAQLRQRLDSGDLIALIGGSIAKPILDVFGSQFACLEPGVGYEGIFGSGTYACFESYAWMHNRYGAYGIGDGRSFDTVIPNAVDPAEWKMDQSDGYALFVGRLIARKGPHAAAQIAKAAGLKLVMAGGGVAHKEPGLVVATDGTRIEGDHVEHVGPVSGLARQELFAKAEVFICPTLYIGPWEGVHAEAMMSGVPVVAPDYGVFTETLPVEHRYRRLKDAVNAIQNPVHERGEEWRNYAINLCGIENCADMYADWIDRICSISDGRNGWYA